MILLMRTVYFLQCVYLPTHYTSFRNDEKRDIKIFLEILRQAVRLPVKHFEVIKKAIATAQRLFLVNLDTTNRIGPKIYEYQQVYSIYTNSIVVDKMITNVYLVHDVVVCLIYGDSGAR